MTCASVGFLCRSHRLLGKKMFQHLSGPDIKGLWGNLSGLTAKEKNSILHGSWRQAPAVKLVPDPDDRDGGGCEKEDVTAQPLLPSELPQTASSTCSSSPSLLFQSDEDLDNFLKQEDADDVEEQKIPTLKLASDFYLDLAATANDELSPVPTNSSMSVRASMTDAERRDEEIAYHAAFFGSYYQQQRVINSTRESWLLQRKYQRPLNTVRFRINEECPLSRLVVRHQLEKSSPVIFRPSVDPMVREVQTAVMSEEDDDSAVAGPDEEDRAVDDISSNVRSGTAECTTALSAGGLQDLLWSDDLSMTCGDKEQIKGRTDALMDSTGHGNCSVSPDSTDEASDALLHNSNKNTALMTPEASFSKPATISQLHWLQRQIASNSVVLLDTLSHVVSELVVRLLCLTTMSSHSIIWDQFALSSVDGGGQDERKGKSKVVYDDASNQRFDYFLDIAQRLLEKQMRISARLNDMKHSRNKNDEYLVLSNIQYQLQSAAVMLIDWSSGASGERRCSTSFLLQDIPCSPHQSPPNLMVLKGNLSPIKKKNTNRPERVKRDSNVKIHSPEICPEFTNTKWKSSHHLPPFIRESCAVILCAPPTSADGQRVRSFEEEREPAREDKRDGGFATLSSRRLPPQDFLVRCRNAVTVNFSRLQIALRTALESAKNGGYVIYATRSMNPVENEAVVCSVLTAHKLAVKNHLPCASDPEEQCPPDVTPFSQSPQKRSYGQADSEVPNEHRESMHFGRDSHASTTSTSPPPPEQGLLQGVAAVECVDVSSWAALHQLNHPSSELHDNAVSYSSFEVEADEDDVWHTLWDAQCTPGLQFWSAVEGGPADHECAAQLPDVLESVSKAARRVKPLTATDDAWFAIVLRVTRIEGDEMPEKALKGKKDLHDHSSVSFFAREVPQNASFSPSSTSLVTRILADDIAFMPHCLCVPFSSQPLPRSTRGLSIPVFFCSSPLFSWYVTHKEPLEKERWKVLQLGAQAGVWRVRESLTARSFLASSSSWKLLSLNRSLCFSNVDSNLVASSVTVDLTPQDGWRDIYWSAAFSGSEYSARLVDFLRAGDLTFSSAALNVEKHSGCSPASETEAVIRQNEGVEYFNTPKKPTVSVDSFHFSVEMPIWLISELLRTSSLSLNQYLSSISSLNAMSSPSDAFLVSHPRSWHSFGSLKKQELCKRWTEDIHLFRKRLLAIFMENMEPNLKCTHKSSNVIASMSIIFSPRETRATLISAVEEEMKRIVLFAEVEFVPIRGHRGIAVTSASRDMEVPYHDGNSSVDWTENDGQLDVVIRWQPDCFSEGISEGSTNLEKRTLKEVSVRLRDALAYVIRRIDDEVMLSCPLEEIGLVFQSCSNFSSRKKTESSIRPSRALEKRSKIKTL